MIYLSAVGVTVQLPTEKLGENQIFLSSIVHVTSRNRAAGVPVREEPVSTGPRERGTVAPWRSSGKRASLGSGWTDIAPRVIEVRREREG
jgi:hypothetical protein